MAVWIEGLEIPEQAVLTGRVWIGWSLRGFGGAFLDVTKSHR
jgi:hypothetical protein